MKNALPAAVVAAAAAAALVLVSGCSSGSTTPSPVAGSPTASSPAASSPAGVNPGGPGQAVGTLHWHACPGQGKVRCAMLSVPLDYANPGGRKIQLALDEVPATAPASQQQGALLVNPGGPGGSGLGLAPFVAQGLNPAVASTYDVIGFDPRGVGSSVPALHCDPTFFSGVRPDYIPAGPAQENVLVNRAKSYAKDCGQNFGFLLPHMTTRDSARDMDSIRAALGQQKISYFAFSYGTYLGEVYATMFPTRVHRMVLDSTVGPKGVWYQDNIGQDYAFQGRFLAFFSWIASHSATFHLGATQAKVRSSWYAARHRLAANPVSGQIGPDEFDDTFLQGGYNNAYWPTLARALASYLHGGATNDLNGAYEQLGHQDENEFAVYNAVECSDVSWPRDWARWDRDTRRVYATAPYQAWDNAWFNAACAFWPVQGPAKPMKIGASGLPGILMLQGTLDGATPYAGAQQAHQALSTTRMVVVKGGGNHGQSLASPPNTCVDGFLNRYLATGELPGRPGAVNATCAALPPPSP
ncbi:MAG: alpha/beta hydrolase [Actinomycetota bacterium]